MLKNVRVYETAEKVVEYALVRRIVLLRTGQIRLEQCLDAAEALGPTRDVLLPAGVPYDVTQAGVYETQAVPSGVAVPPSGPRRRAALRIVR
jgi:hypothetical protein